MFSPISWEELINYKQTTIYKKRPIIIVELDDNLFKRYNAIVIKHDDLKNVHIRYLNNPFYENKYWWSGNKNGDAGLNPLSYHAKSLGDEYDEMEGLKKTDFVEDGYDDIINYQKEPHRFFKSYSNYPFLDGVQGNVHVHNYYISIFNTDLSRGMVPECILRKIGQKDVRRVSLENNDILEGLMMVLPSNSLPVLNDYHLHRWNVAIEKYAIETFKKYLALLLNYEFIKKNGERLKMTKNQLENVKEELKKGYKIPEIIRIVPYLLNCRIILFKCQTTELEIRTYGKANSEMNVFFLEYQNKIYLLI